MSEIQEWPSPYDIEQAQACVPETLYDPDASISPAVERELTVTSGHYLSGYSLADRRELYVHDVAYWRIVAENDGDTEAANKMIAETFFEER